MTSPGSRAGGEVVASAPPTGRAAAAEFGALGFGLVLVMWVMARIPNWSHQLREFQTLQWVAFAFYGLTVFRLGRYRALPAAGLFVLAVAFATRAALLPVQPSLSDDIYRYVWEGRVIAHGGNPYRSAPSSAELAPLRDAVIWPRVNHPDLATIYPPLAEAGFACIARISPTVAAMKAWVVLADLTLVGVVLRLCARSGGAAAALIYAWNPLMLVEYAGNGHLEPVAMAPLALAVLWIRRRPVLSALALAAGVLIKLAPLLALPVLAVRWPSRARWTCALVLIPALAWFWAATRGADSGLLAYWQSWRNNALFFDWIERWSGQAMLARAATIVAVAVATLWALARPFDPARAARGVFRTATLFSPVIHPWYLGWPLLFEPLAPSAPWLLLSATACLNYGLFAAPADRAGYHLPPAWRLVEFGLPAMLAVALWGRRRLARASRQGAGRA
jgi:hypothetical protein